MCHYAMVRQSEYSISEENPGPNGRSLVFRAECLLMTLQETLSIDQFKISVMQGLASVEVLPTGTWLLVAASGPQGSALTILPTYAEQQIDRYDSAWRCAACLSFLNRTERQSMSVVGFVGYLVCRADLEEFRAFTETIRSSTRRGLCWGRC